MYSYIAQAVNYIWKLNTLWIFNGCRWLLSLGSSSGRSMLTTLPLPALDLWKCGAISVLPPHVFLGCIDRSTFTCFIGSESWSLLFTVLFSDATNFSVYIVSSEETNNGNRLEGERKEGVWRNLKQCPAIYQYLSHKNRYQGADKSLARPGRKQATATKL